MPPNWGFHNDLELVINGYDEWEARDFGEIPDKQKVADRDPMWRADLFLFKRLVKMQRKKVEPFDPNSK